MATHHFNAKKRAFQRAKELRARGLTVTLAKNKRETGYNYTLYSYRE